MDEFVERRILTGLIVSKDYLSRVAPIWDQSYLESPEVQLIASWCLEHYERYGRAPEEDIEDIYVERKKTLPSPADQKYVEELLSNLSEEYGRGTKFNSSYLFDQTVRYFRSRKLMRHNEQLAELVEAGKVEEAEQFAKSYRPTLLDKMARGLELSDDEALARVERAFSHAPIPLVSFPGDLGKMLNGQLARDGFVGFMGPEKRGKSFWLLEIGLRAVRQRCNVAFFEAGDLSEAQVLRRIATCLAGRSHLEKYCEEHWRAVGDCVWNQLDTCSRGDRNCDHGIFPGVDALTYRAGPDEYGGLEVLQHAAADFPKYEPCDSHLCDKRQGAVWVRLEPRRKPLTGAAARKQCGLFFRKHRRSFRLATHPAGTLSVEEIRSCLDEWEKLDGVLFDVVIVDYADLLSSPVVEFRHRQDHIWKSLRGLSQERHCLVVTATQADANSYSRNTLTLSNFSEDKRKYSHITAMYGLNQDPKGKEKKLGLLRLNELMVREGDFSQDHEVTVIQDLYLGRPFLESFRGKIELDGSRRSNV